MIAARHAARDRERCASRLPKTADRLRARVAPIGRRTGWRSVAALVLRLA